MDKLKQLDQWICWKEVTVDDKPTKIPMSVTGKKASTTDKSTWSSFSDALSYFTSTDGIDGIGFVFTSHDPYCGIDLDKCRHPITGEINGEAKAIIKSLDSYTEISPSGKGIHVIIEGKKNGAKSRKGKVEIYDAGRYFTVTENVWKGLNKIQCRQKQLDALYDELFPSKPKLDYPAVDISIDDSVLIDKAMKASDGAKFTELWNGGTFSYDSHSEADLALCNMLVFWTGGDKGRIDRLFRQSGLYREKWEREDYRNKTIDASLEKVSERYDPYYSDSPDLPSSKSKVESEPDAEKIHFDRDAETAVLSIAIQRNGLIPLIREQVGHNENAFAVSVHKQIYRSILDIDGTVDEITLANRLREKKCSDSIIKSIPNLISQEFNADNITDYCSIVKCNYTKRQIVAAGKKISLIPNEDIETDAMLVKAQEKVMDVGITTSKRKTIQEQCDKTFSNLVTQGKNHIEIPTGFSNFDLLTGGLHKKLFYIIAGLPSLGKSAFLHNMLYYAAVEKHIPSVLFCYESNDEAIIKRMISLSTGVDLSYGMKPSDKESVLHAVTLISKSPLTIIDDIDPSIETAIATTQRLKAENPDLVIGVYDHMHLMTTHSKDNEEGVVRTISHGLKTLAKQVDMAIVGISQLSRASIRRQDSRPTLSDLRHSGALEADADLAAFLYREDYQEEISEISPTELIIRKQKDGEIGTLYYDYHRKLSKFMEA